jgi:hypothetical protein
VGGSWIVLIPANVLECETASSAASSPSTETLLAGCGDAEIGEPDRVPTEGGGQGYVGLKRSHVGCDKVQNTRERKRGRSGCEIDPKCERLDPMEMEIGNKRK